MDANHELIVHVASYHANREAAYNERNPGLGLRLRKPNGDWALAMGLYRNSLRHDTVYLGATYDIAKAGPMTFRALGGVVTGYRIALAPVVTPEIVLSFGCCGLAFNYLPNIKVGDYHVSEVVSFSLMKRL